MKRSTSLNQCARLKLIRISSTGTIYRKQPFYEARRVKESDRFQVAWLAYLINDYGASPEWIMSGKGKMFR
jgi:hypothetical protein